MSLPDRKYLTHRPQEVRNLSAKAQAALAELPSERFLYQSKHDGCSIQILVGINVVRIFSREGKECVSMPHIAEHFRKVSPPNMVYFGESWHPDMEFKDISGMFRRQSAQPDLQAWLFDAVTLQEYRKGVAARPYAMRQKALAGVLSHGAGVYPVISAYSPLHVQERVASIRSSTDWKFRLDGLIQRDIEGFWQAGKDNVGAVLKLKDVLSVDLEVAGVVEGEGKFKGMVGALEVYWKGKREVVSGGKLTNEERQEFFRDPLSIVGKIVEVHALGLTPDGKLREPRYQRLRDDKTEVSE